MDEKPKYQVIISKPAQKRYQREILNYLLDNFSLSRCVEIDENILATVSSLTTFPNRGKTEKLLENHSMKFRFILHKESRNLEIKIIYYVEKLNSRVVITDFFPVLMKPISITLRS